jgi:hypothetical protein
MDEAILTGITFSPYEWVGVAFLFLCVLVVIKIGLDIIRVEYRVFKLRRRR